MLFLTARRGEPVAFSCARPGTPVLKRGDGVLEAREAIHGAYVFKPFRENGKPKKVLAISGGQVMHNVKIVAVTSPQLYEELRRSAPAKAAAILSDEERQSVVPCTTDGRDFCTHLLCRGITRAASLAWTAFPDPGSRTKSTGTPASIARDSGRRS